MSDVVEMVQKELKDIGANFSEVKGRLTELEQRAVRGGGKAGKSTSVFAEICNNEKLDLLRNHESKSVTIPSEAGIKMMRKGIVGDAGDSTWSSYPVSPQRYDGFGGDARRKLSLLDVLPVIPVDSGSFEFVKLDSFTNGADYQVAQADTKAEQAVDVTLETSTIATIAITLPMSEQVLADSPALESFMSGKLTYGVLEKFERELIAGGGTTGKISGLLTEATAFAPTSNGYGADAIGEALAKLETDGYTGGLIVMHPNDWHTIRSERASTSNEYVAGGWNSPAGPNVWGIPVVTSAAMTEGKAIVMDTNQVSILDRMMPRYQLAYSGTGFEQNVITARAELRGGLAVFSPSSVLSLDI